MATWLDGMVVMSAFIRLAMVSSNAGGIVRSLLATMYHDGFFFQAGFVVGESRHFAFVGTCAAVNTFFSMSVRSCAKHSQRNTFAESAVHTTKIITLPPRQPGAPTTDRLSKFPQAMTLHRSAATLAPRRGAPAAAIPRQRRVPKGRAWGTG